MWPGRLALALTLGGCHLVFGVDPGGGGPRPDGAPDGAGGASADAPAPGRASAIGAGTQHTCAIVDDQVRCWGSGTDGRLGLPFVTSIGLGEPASAAAPLDLAALVPTELSVGADHACVRATTGAAMCWGNNARGQLGLGDTSPVGDDEPPFAGGTNPLGPVGQIQAGRHVTCATTSGNSGGLVCWGDNSQGMLGQAPQRGDALGDNEPLSTAAVMPVGARSVAVGGSHVCIVDDAAHVRCWGSDLRGQRGDADMVPADASAAASVVVPALPAIDEVVAGDAHTCARTTMGAVYCWGAMAQVGILANADLPAPGLPVDLPDDAIALAAGASHTCALLAGGGVRCWGAGDAGQLGYGNTMPFQVPPVDVALGGPATAIAAGGAHTCAILTSGDVVCWGAGGAGQLGYGDANDRLTPMGPVPLVPP